MATTKNKPRPLYSVTDEQARMDILKVPNKNYIINGNFDVWQRGTSQISSGYGSDDRWANDSNGSTKVHTQETFAVGQTEVPNNPKYYNKTVVTSVAGSNNYSVKIQKLENVSTLAGQEATLSFWARADASKNMAIELKQIFGTGGSAEVKAISPQLVPLTTVWVKHEILVSIPSISGKTIGIDDSLALNLWFDAGTDRDYRASNLGQQSGTFDIAQVKLEKGSVATEFVPKTYAEELRDCQRYYWKMKGNNAYTIFGLGSAPGTTSLIISALKLPVTMRLVPTLAYYGNFITLTDGRTITNITLVSDGSSNDFVSLLVYSTGFTIYRAYVVRSNNDLTAYISFDAEL